MGEALSSSSMPDTFFAPAGRDTPVDFAKKREIVTNSRMLNAALDAIPGMVMILNTNRQIVSANRAMYLILQVRDEDLLEKRPGEVIGCLHAKDGPDGCGTSRYCMTCGAANAVLESQAKNAQVVRECRVATGEPSGAGAMDIRVTATPIEVEAQPFIVVAVEDISQAKRMAVLQRTFFHDVLNTAGCISGYAEYLSQQHEAVNEVSGLLMRLSDQLVEEINAQRDLVLAESGDLKLQVEMVLTANLLDDLRAQYTKSPVAEGRRIELGEVTAAAIRTDPQLLQRILGNMIKNALEGTPPGQTVRLSCTGRDEEIVFAVHNPGVMPEEVQLQMFQRSFSTKGQHGRGIGTYSMKLFGERYLGGKVAFTSRDPDGTTFTLTLPKRPPEEATA